METKRFSAEGAPRFGSCLEHGSAHTEDHLRWSRRDFIRMLGLGAGSAFFLGRTPVEAFGSAPLLAHLRAVETDRVLVLVQLNGGNDGLNTVVPFENDVYYNFRPDIAIAKNTVLKLNTEIGLHPSLSSFNTLFQDGRLAVLQNTGYPSPNLSHFRSTDIWLSGSDADKVVPTGWAGRYLDAEFPTFHTDPGNHPLAVQLGGTASLLTQGPQTGMGMSLASPEIFSRIAERGVVYETDNLPAGPMGAEMDFVRTVANDSFQYAGAVQQASAAGKNQVAYPTGNGLASNLSIVARLIKGRLGARIYHVALGGFDTHANQLTNHANLLRSLSEAVKAFYDDLAAARGAENVMVMTFSEFGRRPRQNGSRGTDHGTAAPLFIIGGSVAGGVFGKAPSLSDLDSSSNLKYEIDFRSAYATILKDWFGLAPSAVASVLGGSFGTLPFVSAPVQTASPRPSETPEAFTLHGNYPNPFNPTTIIVYSLAQPGRVRLDIFDTLGRRVQTLVDEEQAVGKHELPFDAYGLPSGTYLYRLQTPFGVQTRKMVLVR